MAPDRSDDDPWDGWFDWVDWPWVWIVLLVVFVGEAVWYGLLR